VTTENLRPRVADAVRRGKQYLYDRQRYDGSWEDRMSSSAISTAIGLLALARANRQGHDWQIRAGLQWLRDNQRADGGWSLVDADPPSDEYITAFAVAAFKVIDPDTYTSCIERGMAYIEVHGGESIITPPLHDGGPRTWREIVPIVWAMEGLRDVGVQPSQPMEVMLLPPALRNRASIVLPGVLGIGIAQSRVLPAGRLKSWAQRLAEPRALAWLRAAMGPNGGIEECALMCALVFSGLRSAGRDVGADIQEGCLRFLINTQRPDGSWPIDRDLEISVTCYSVLAVAECVDDLTAEGMLRPTRDWLLTKQWRQEFAPLKMPPGGWSWASPSGWPESEDTAVVLAALADLGVSEQDSQVRLGLKWLDGMQNRDGSWSEWMRNSTMIHDGPCPGVTAHVLLAYNKYGVDVGDKRIARALAYFEKTQAADGSFSSLWFRDNTHGTAKVLETYAELGLLDSPVATRAATWLRDNQRPDGAWPAKAVEGPPDGGTVEETGWAVFSLLLAGDAPDAPHLLRAVEWLVDTQMGNSTWRPQGVGLYYDTLYYSDDLIAHAYALRALGRWLTTSGQQSPV